MSGTAALAIAVIIGVVLGILSAYERTAEYNRKKHKGKASKMLFL